jgi:hypothetical protein
MRGESFMKKQLILVVSASLLFISNRAVAGPKVNLDWGYQLHDSDTACPNMKPVLNVKRKITNSLDSGTGQNDFGSAWWAYIDYNEQIKVVQTGEDSFCATVQSVGKFESVGGDGPGCANDGNCGKLDGRLEAGVSGTFQGGETISIVGTFTPGGKNTKGKIGTINQDCDPSTSAGCSSKGLTAFIDEYFTNASVSLDWWGWRYNGGKNGRWVNSSDGNSGNITGDYKIHD